jgi:molybdopterin molybdotransferase
LFFSLDQLNLEINMPEFLKLVTPEQALEILFRSVTPKIKVEAVQTQFASGRILAEDIESPQDLPDFRRSTVDGYAVQSKNTHGASESLPAYLNMIGEILMGSAPDLALNDQECALIHTGGMLPPGADAVVMLEDTQSLETGEIEIFNAAAKGENVIEIGEDVKAGEMIFPCGTRLRPQEIGGLLGLGITEIKVSKPPVIGILSSGDEVIPPDVVPKPGEVRDINSYTLGALVREVGGEVNQYGIISDSRENMREAVKKARMECDHLIVTAGSSASARDITAEILNEAGNPGVLVHGISIKPGKPTILAISGDQVLIGLPGNPVSALVIAMVVVKPIIEAYLGYTETRPTPTVTAELVSNISSQAGREDWIPVRLTRNPKGNQTAEPVFGRSNLIFVLARSDGLIKIPAPSTGLEAGTVVDVRLI